MASTATVGNRSLLFLPLVFGATCLSLAATLDGDTGPELCVFRKCTGGYCPGCGGSRAFVRLAKGDLAGSWAAHPWVPLLMLQLIVAIAMVSAGRRQQLRSWLLPFLAGNMVLGLTIWVIRLSMGSIPIPFS